MLPDGSRRIMPSCMRICRQVHLDKVKGTRHDQARTGEDKCGSHK
jgi:hypothetical protein